MTEDELSKKTPGQELYELLNPYDPAACANPAQWHETDEDFQAHYERCALKYHESLRASLANAERRAELAEERYDMLCEAVDAIKELRDGVEK